MSSNGLYNPDQNAVNTRWVQPWSEAFRAQRDVGLRVPINFQTMPGVSLTAVCFNADTYEHNAFQKCFSNLLAVGFRKFTVDTYWDPLRQVWSLCPVQLPRSNGASSGNGDASVRTGQTIVPSSDTGTAQAPQSTVPLPPGAQRRQETQISTPVAVEPSSATLPSVVDVPSSSVSSTASSAASPTIIDYPSPSGPPLLQIGNYNCTSLTTLDLLTGILADFLDSTATTTGAALTLFAFNVHAASSIDNPNGEAPSVSQDQLPKQGQLLSDLLRGNLSDELYKPTLLSDQRANLNNSWYNVEWNNRPLDGYYQVSENAQGQPYTDSGWPTEAFMEFKQLFRLVAGYGDIDAQMKEYNVAGDSGYIFPPNTILNQKAMTVGSDGLVTSGCLFNPSDETITSGTNSSWAISTAPELNVSSNPDLTLPIASITNLTACGTTPWLNETLNNTPADRNPLPYAAYVHSTLWTFAPGEPLNATQGDEQRTINRCVVMTKSPYPSRWRTTDCRESHRVACHDPSSPYAWRISSESSNYAAADTHCSPPYRFSVPHTALENAHLFAAFEALQSDRREDDVIYVNLNSINTPDCWVVGLNSTCPYLPSTETDRTKIVVVPTVAAVIIFLLAVMTFFLKCAANRRENKRGRKRRLVGGWEYEGVPS